MKKLLGITGATLGGWIGWWIGAHVGIMTAFMVGTICSGAGLYIALRLMRNYLE